MIKKTLLLLCTLSLIPCLCVIKSAYAIFSKLTPEQVQEAIEYGQRNKSLDIVTFSKSWTTSLEKGKGFATLFTLYHNIAYKARKFAVEQREFTNREIQEVLQTGDALSFSVTVYGDEYDFALHYSAMVYQKDAVIQPEFEFVPEIAEASESWPDSPSYLARLVFKFPMDDIDINTPIIFVVMVPGGEEIHFQFDLAKIK